MSNKSTKSTKRGYSSPVDLDFVIQIDDASNEDVVIMRTSQFTSYLSTVSSLLNEEDVRKSEKDKINEILSRVKSILNKVDQKRFRVNREYINESAKEISIIRDETAKIRFDRNMFKSDSSISAINQLHTTINTIKAFCDNCFRCNFM